MFEGLSRVVLLFSAMLIREEYIFELDFFPRDMSRQKLSYMWNISLCKDEGHIHRSVRQLKFSQLRNPKSTLIKFTVVFSFPEDLNVRTYLELLVVIGKGNKVPQRRPEIPA